LNIYWKYFHESLFKNLKDIFILTHCGQITSILVFSVLELVANHENSRSIPFNNYGEHDKILDIFANNFSDITSESERSEEDDSDS